MSSFYLRCDVVIYPIPFLSFHLGLCLPIYKDKWLLALSFYWIILQNVDGKIIGGEAFIFLHMCRFLDGINSIIFKNVPFDIFWLSHKICASYKEYEQKPQPKKNKRIKFIDFSILNPNGFFIRATQSMVCGCGVYITLSSEVQDQFWGNGGSSLNTKADVFSLWGILCCAKWQRTTQFLSLLNSYLWRFTSHEWLDQWGFDLNASPPYDLAT